MAIVGSLVLCDAIGQIALAALRGQDPDKVIAIGVKVANAISDFKRKHPEEVPKRRLTGGLLPLPPTDHPVQDFTLAHHLALSCHPWLARLQHEAGDIDVLLAYLLVMVSLEDFPVERIGLDDALAYATTANGVFLQRVRNRVSELSPLARHGEQMRNGRKRGTPGPVAKKVHSYLKSHPTATAIDVWEALKCRPPKGYEFRDGNAKLGRYIERGAVTVMHWRRFQNIVSEQRRKD